MDGKEKIENLYFDENYNLTEISKKVNKSVSYISRILRKNANYTLEKENRKKRALENRRKKQKTLIYKNRRKKEIDVAYQQVKSSHAQATKELSKGSKIGNQALRKWCANSYKYDKKKKRYEFDAGNALKPADMPKYIKL